MSQASAISQPPPKAMPLIAAIVGRGARSISRVSCWPPTATEPPALGNSLTSAPAAKKRVPAPVITRARTSPSATAPATAARRPSTTAAPIAFAGGWSMVTRATLPSIWTETGSDTPTPPGPDRPHSPRE